MKKILVIEDSTETRSHLADIIRAYEGHQIRVYEAEDGLQGIKKAKQHIPDIIFMDIVLPYISGYAASVRLRKIEKLRNTIIIGMTADDEENTKGKVLAWCDAFIPKPLDEKRVNRLLKKYLGDDEHKTSSHVPKRRKLDIKTQLTSEIVEQLETRVVELETAKKRIKKLNHLKAQMVDMLSHEIKTPLTIIVGYGEVLKMAAQQCLDTEAETMINKINDASARISTLISEINSLNRLQFNIKAGAQCNLKKSINRILEKRKKYIEDKHIEVFIGDIDPELMLPMTDSYFDEFFDHIIKNAIIYNMKKGDIQIEVVKRVDVVKISVNDSGVGLPEDLTDYIFNPLTQNVDVEHHKTHPLRGLGMGLAICREMIENVGGQIELKNREDSNGTTVIMKLPVIQ